MTRDEVMALSDEELRVKVAELRGWTDCEAFISGAAPVGHPPEGAYRSLGLDEDAFLEIPDYPHDIAAAWELRKEMLDAGFVVSESSSLIQDFTLFRDRPAVAFFPFDESRPQETFLGEEKGDEPRLFTRAFVLAMTQGDA